MQSRRDVLRMGAGLAGTGVATSLAGCSRVPVVGSYFEDDPVYPQWVYAPEAVERESLSVERTDVAGLLELDSVQNDRVREEFADEFGGADVEDVEYVLEFDQNEVMSVSFDGTAIGDELDAESDGSYGNFDLYANDSSTVALSEDYVLRANDGYRSERSPRDRIELLIDTYTGEAERFVDESDHFERAVAALDTGVVVEARGDASEQIEEADDDAVVAGGMTADADGETTLLRYVDVFKSEDGYDPDELEAEYEGFAESDPDIEMGDLSSDGPAVIAEFELPTERFTESW